MLESSLLLAVQRSKQGLNSSKQLIIAGLGGEHDMSQEPGLFGSGDRGVRMTYQYLLRVIDPLMDILTYSGELVPDGYMQKSALPLQCPLLPLHGHGTNRITIITLDLGWSLKPFEKYQYIGSLIKAIRENIDYPRGLPRDDVANPCLLVL